MVNKKIHIMGDNSYPLITNEIELEKLFISEPILIIDFGIIAENQLQY